MDALQQRGKKLRDECRARGIQIQEIADYCRENHPGMLSAKHRSYLSMALTAKRTRSKPMQDIVAAYLAMKTEEEEVRKEVDALIEKARATINTPYSTKYTGTLVK